MGDLFPVLIGGFNLFCKPFHEFSQISSAVRLYFGTLDDIASVSEELAAGVEQAAASAEQSNNSIEEVSYRAGELAQLAEQLKERIGHFRL